MEENQLNRFTKRSIQSITEPSGQSDNNIHVIQQPKKSQRKLNFRLKSKKNIPISQRSQPKMSMLSQLIKNNLNRSLLHKKKPRVLYENYFKMVEHLKTKESQEDKMQRKDHQINSVERLHRKLKSQIAQFNEKSSVQNLQENFRVMQICLQKKHTRNFSENVFDKSSSKGKIRQRIQSSKMSQSRLRKYKQPQKKNIPMKLAFNCQKKEKLQFCGQFYQEKTNRIIKQCKKENSEIVQITEKIGLLNFYTKRIDSRFNIHMCKIKKWMIGEV